MGNNPESSGLGEAWLAGFRDVVVTLPAFDFEL
jgi:hypothetical protein